MLSALALVPLVASVSAHSIFQQLYVDGVSPGQKFGIRMPVSNSPIENVDSADLGCNVTPGSSTDIINVPAGSTVTAEWHQGTDPSQYGTGDDPIAVSHHGPIMTYVAKVDNATTASSAGLSWVKIQEEGFHPATKDWATDTMIAQKGKFDVKIPSCLASGHYLLRQELIALHSAGSYPGAQFYTSCAQIQITGGGSSSPAGVQIPGAYKSSDPGVTISIYYPEVTSYTIPGPRPFTCDGSSEPEPTSDEPTTPPSTTDVPEEPTSTPEPEPTSTPTTTDAPTTPPTTENPPPSTTSTSPSGGVSTTWGQCGGINYSGPTACPSGTGCKVLNPYYSQCIPGAQGLQPSGTDGAASPAQTQYGQCGGQNWKGLTACASGTTCKVQNPYYSQCL